MQAPFNSQLSALIVAASNAPVYTRRSLLGVDGPQTPGASAQPRPMHKPPVASAGLSILGREGTPGGPPLGERTTAAGSTTTRLRVVGKCALREGRQRERSAQVIPRRSRFGSLLLVDHRLSSLCHFATNEPSANVYLDGETTLYTIHLKRRICDFDRNFEQVRAREEAYQQAGQGPCTAEAETKKAIKQAARCKKKAENGNSSILRPLSVRPILPGRCRKCNFLRLLFYGHLPRRGAPFLCI